MVSWFPQTIHALLSACISRVADRFCFESRQIICQLRSSLCRPARGDRVPFWTAAAAHVHGACPAGPEQAQQAGSAEEISFYNFGRKLAHPPSLVQVEATRSKQTSEFLIASDSSLTPVSVHQPRYGISVAEGLPGLACRGVQPELPEGCRAVWRCLA